MTWQDLVNDGTAVPHRTRLTEISALRAVVERDLTDAAIAGLSADRRFATAYNAALQLCKMAICVRATGSK